MVVGSSVPHPDIAQITNGEGRFRFDELSAGTYTLAAYLPDGRETRGTFSLARGEHIQYDLTVEQPQHD